MVSGTRCADPGCGHPLVDHDADDGDGCMGAVEHPAVGPPDDCDPPWSERCFCPQFHETFEEDQS